MRHLPGIKRWMKPTAAIDVCCVLLAWKWTGCVSLPQIQNVPNCRRRKGNEEEITVTKHHYKLLRGPNTHVAPYIKPIYSEWLLIHIAPGEIISIHLHLALTLFRCKCNAQKFMHLDVSQIQPKLTTPPPQYNSKDNFVMASQFEIPFEFKVAIKQYHKRESALHGSFTHNKALQLFNLCCLAASCWLLCYGFESANKMEWHLWDTRLTCIGTYSNDCDRWAHWQW